MPTPFHLLVVEDEAYIRELISTIFEGTGVAVTAVADGAAALRAARSQPLPDLILLDVVLPVLDGISVVRHLKSDPATRTIPAYMLSARIRENDREAASRAGADGYLEKPFRSAELLALVERHRPVG